jgi:hypothetical protein
MSDGVLSYLLGTPQFCHHRPRVRCSRLHSIDLPQLPVGHQALEINLLFGTAYHGFKKTEAWTWNQLISLSLK